MSSRPKRTKANLHPGLLVKPTTRPRRTPAQMAVARHAEESEALTAQAKLDATNQRIAELTAQTRQHVSTEVAQSSQPINVSQLTIKARNRASRQAVSKQVRFKPATAAEIMSSAQPMAVDSAVSS